MTDNAKKFYCTTAIDYPNGSPHMGHAYEKIVTDTYERWYKFLGAETFFLTGTDENGQKLVESAKAAGQPTGTYVDEQVVKFKKLCRDLSIGYNDFIRTTEERHMKVCQDFWSRLQTKGEIYQGTYSGDDNGTWKSTISTDGKFTGTATSNLAPNYPFTINGTVSNTGVIEAKYSYLSYTASFKGQITGSEASGTWKTDTLNLGGTWSGKKQ